jgi:hypothetical protein
MKQLPNLVDMNEINNEIKNTLFKKTTYRVNIILGLIFIFTVLLFIYLGINSKKNNDDIPSDDNIYNEPILEEDNIYYTGNFIDPAELALLS